MSQSLFSDASQRLDEALKYASISDDAIERLKLPKSSLKVSIPVRMDSGELRIFPGYRVRYDDTRGPTKGGIRYHQDVSIDEVQSSSLLDDLQMRGGQFALWRRQGGYHGQSQGTVSF